MSVSLVSLMSIIKLLSVIQAYSTQRRISQVFDSFDNMIERNKDLIDIVNEERESIQWKLLGQY